MAGVSKLTDNLLSNRQVIVIGGATASGKTDLSIALGKEIPIEIVSADSRQFYKYMNIGTAKPTADELAAVPHHFIDILEPSDSFSAGKYANKARTTIDDIFLRGKIPLVIGGSGLYIQALCEGFFDDGKDDDNEDIIFHRKRLENELAENGIEPLYNSLTEIDPASAAKYQDKNPRRIIRALEYYYSNGITFSKAMEQFSNPNISFKPLYFAIHWEREVLYDRINRRTQIMWQSGLLEEVEKLLEMGYSRDLNALNTVGYKEVFDFIDGKLSQAETIDLIAQHTRNYAKRQFTWFKRIPSIQWVENDVRKLLGLLESV